ncbi:MAG: DUF1292 domain-containing protein [Lachnospiraceae bacterium]|nr:DUF1292 domain-containing protein [Lachnospiraceae bacterium]
MDEDMIVLTDADGEETVFEVLDVIEHRGEEYVVLIPEGADEDEPVHIFRIASEDLDAEEVSYEGLDDEELIQTVFQKFCKRNGL